MEVVVFCGVLAVTLVTGLPVAFALAVGALVLLVGFAEGLPLKGMIVVLAQRLWSGTDSFPLLAMPLFFLAGGLMEAGGISERLIRLGVAIVGWIRGGLSMVAVFASMLMAGITGSASADAAAVGSVIIPAMERRGYPRAYAAALLASAGSMGPIIPPSILLIIYGSLANVSVSKLFIGGILPGIVFGGALMVLCYFIARLRDYPAEKKFSLHQVSEALYDAIFPILAPLIIIGGILGGIFTATEAAMVASVYAFLVGKFVYRTLSWKEFCNVCYETSISSARVMFIIGVAAFVSWVLARERVPQQLGEHLLSVADNPFTLLIIINLIVLVFGMFLEATAIMVILLPTLMPLVLQMNIDPVFFGVVLIVNLAIGTVTPPLGTCLFVTTAIAKVPYHHVAREVVPFLAIMILVLFLLVFFPSITLWLPQVAL